MSIEKQLINLGKARKDLRPHIRPVLAELERESLPTSNGKVAQHIRQAQRKIYQSVPKELRALHAMLRISSEPRKKKAFSQGDITRLINQMLDRGGITKNLTEEGLAIPNIDWGKLFMVAISQMSHKLNLSNTLREEFLNDVVGDMVMGQSIMTVRETGPWKQNLMEQIEEWVLDGYNENRIKASLTSWIKNKIQNLWKRWKAQRGHTDDIGFEVGSPGDDYQGKDVYENLFNMDGLTGGQMGHYQRLIRQNPVVKDIVDRITRKLEQRDDTIGYLWQAYLKDPTATLEHLLTISVDATVDGRRQSVPLWEAMGFDGPNESRQKVNYHVKKLRKHLKTMWPDIDDILRDLKGI